MTNFSRGDVVLVSKEAGLLLPSLATGIIRTIKRGMITRKLSTISREDMKGIERQLNIALDLG